MIGILHPSFFIRILIYYSLTGDEGTGDEGTGKKGTGDEGTGDEGTGVKGICDKGTSDKGWGDKRTGDKKTCDKGTYSKGIWEKINRVNLSIFKKIFNLTKIIYTLTNLKKNVEKEIFL